MKRRKRIKPDDALTFGPLTMARFGKNVAINVDWNESDFEKHQELLANQLPKLEQQINELVASIELQIKSLPSEKLLHRAWFELAGQIILTRSEAEIGRDQIISMRMIDYVQSMIAATMPDENQKKELSDADWIELRSSVEGLFDLVNFPYHLAATAVKRKENPDFDIELEEIRFKAQLYWCNVRGARYHALQLPALSDLLLPQNAVLQEVFGISSAELIAEISKIFRSLTYGLGEAAGEIERVQIATLAEIEAQIEDGNIDPSAPPENAIPETVQQLGLTDRMHKAVSEFFGFDLFDLEKQTNLPRDFLRQFSWDAGEEQTFLAPGPFRGWPLREWPIFKRPFICLSGRFYCFDTASLFDHFFRSIEKKVFAHSDRAKNQWLRIRQGTSERLPLSLLEKLLPDCTIYSGVNYQATLGTPPRQQWCEVDGLVLSEDHLFIVEVKGGAYTYTSPTIDFDAHIESLRNLIDAPIKQGQRFLRALQDNGHIEIFDSSRKKIRSLDTEQFRHVTVCAISLDVLTELASQAQHLSSVGVNVGDGPVWSLSIDDLRVYSETIKNPLEFLHFVENRIRALRTADVKVDDELDHFALYLEHNNYSNYAGQMRAKGAQPPQFAGYRDRIDRHFSELMEDAGQTAGLQQQLPYRLREIIDFLADSHVRQRAKLASYLLDLSGDTREKIFEQVEIELERQAGGAAARPLSSHGEVRLTLLSGFDSSSVHTRVDWLDHVRAVMMLNDETDRIFIESKYDSARQLVSIHWREVTLVALSNTEQDRIKTLAERLRGVRLANAKATSGKIGRNSPCPCGSGKKYKRCCLRS